MKLNKIYLGCLLFLGMTTTSCDGFLTEPNPNNRPTTEFWRTLTEADQSLSAVYASFRNGSVLGIQEEAFRSDMAWPGSGRPIPASQGKEYNFYIHNYNNTTDHINKKWEACYSGIFRANQTIRGLNRLKGTLTTDKELATWTKIMAQARFFRGLYHFYLHTSYNNGKILIIDEIPVNLEDFHRSLSESEDVVSFFRKDLQYAYENLPIEYAAANDKGRVTSGVAATILGTSYLYEFSATGNDQILNLAMSMFRFVMTECGYELMQSGDDLFTEDNELNKESIFEIIYSDDIRPEMGDWDVNNFIQNIAFGTTQFNGGHFLPAWMANAYQVEPIDPLNPRNYYEQTQEDGSITSELRKMPLRASAMVALWEDVYTPWYTKASVPEGGKNFSLNNNGFGYYRKFSDSKTLPKDEQRSGMNIVVNRLPEVYLMYAECLIEKGDITEALRVINELRERWGLVLLGQDMGDGFTYDNIPYNKESLMKHLREVEKPLECSLEGHMVRWADLRRWGMLESNLQKLSEAVYYGVNSKVTTPAGKLLSMSADQFGVVRNQAEILANPATCKLIDFEYDLAYKTFRYEEHAYYPIPMDEIENNPNINK